MASAAVEPGSERVYATLRRQILRLDLRPGEDLDEGAVSGRLAVSRTPVREALIRLTAEGLVTSVRGRGARVAPLDIGDLRAFFEGLDILQRSVTRMAAHRRTADDLERIEGHLIDCERGASALDSEAVAEKNYAFHAAIGEAAQSSFLANAYRRSLTEGLRIGYVCFSEHSGVDERLTTHLGSTMDDHRKMFAAIAAQDADAAEEVAGAHVDLFRNRVATVVLSTELARRVSVGERPHRR